MVSRFADFDWSEFEDEFFESERAKKQPRSSRDQLLEHLALKVIPGESYESKWWLRRRLLIAAFDQRWFTQARPNVGSDRESDDPEIKFRSPKLASMLEKYSSLRSGVKLPSAFPRTPLWRRHRIPKKGGRGSRQLTIPSASFKPVLSEVERILTRSSKEVIPACVYGVCGKGRSSVDNARFHAGGRFCLSYDIQDCFESIGFGHVLAAIRELRVLHLSKDVSVRVDLDSAVFLAGLLTNHRVLPQGAPTSPLLANLVLSKLDAEILSSIDPNGIRYSRYFDDLTFSIAARDAKRTHIDRKRFSKLVGSAVRDGVRSIGLDLNESKTRFGSFDSSFQVTGVVVSGDRIGLRREMRRKLRATSWRLRNHGLLAGPTSPPSRPPAEIPSSSDWKFWKKIAIDVRSIRNLVTRGILDRSSEPASVMPIRSETRELWRRFRSERSGEDPETGRPTFIFRSEDFNVDYEEIEHREDSDEMRIPNWSTLELDEEKDEALGRRSGSRRAIRDAPVNWLRLRLWREGGEESVKIVDKVGRAAWKAVETSKLMAVDVRGGTRLWRRDAVLINAGDGITMGIADPTGVLPGLLRCSVADRIQILDQCRRIRGLLAYGAQFRRDASEKGAADLFEDLKSALVDAWHRLANQHPVEDSGRSDRRRIEFAVETREEAAIRLQHEREEEDLVRAKAAVLPYVVDMTGLQRQELMSILGVLTKTPDDPGPWFEACRSVVEALPDSIPLGSEDCMRSVGGPLVGFSPLLRAAALAPSVQDRIGDYQWERFERTRKQKEAAVVFVTATKLADIQASVIEGFEEIVLQRNNTSKVAVDLKERSLQLVEDFGKAQRCLVANEVGCFHYQISDTELEGLRAAIRQDEEIGVWQVMAILNEWTFGCLVEMADGNEISEGESYKLARQDFVSKISDRKASAWVDQKLSTFRNIFGHRNFLVGKYLSVLIQKGRGKSAEDVRDLCRELRRDLMQMIGRCDEQWADLPSDSSPLLDGLFTAYEVREVKYRAILLVTRALASIDPPDSKA